MAFGTPLAASGVPALASSTSTTVSWPARRRDTSAAGWAGNCAGRTNADLPAGRNGQKRHADSSRIWSGALRASPFTCGRLRSRHCWRGLAPRLLDPASHNQHGRNGLPTSSWRCAGTCEECTTLDDWFPSPCNPVLVARRTCPRALRTGQRVDATNMLGQGTRQTKPCAPVCKELSERRSKCCVAKRSKRGQLARHPRPAPPKPLPLSSSRARPSRSFRSFTPLFPMSLNTHITRLLPFHPPPPRVLRS